MTKLHIIYPEIGEELVSVLTLEEINGFYVLRPIIVMIYVTLWGASK
jgi:hypothetical protein